MMKVILPAKENSTRVPKKNWREFYESKSLTDVKIEQLLKVFSGKDIFLSCDVKKRKVHAEKYGINFHLRSPELAEDETPWSEVVLGILRDLPVKDFEDILWTEATSPLFSDYDALLKTWEEKKLSFDSLLTVKAQRDFFFWKNGQPINFQFGKWHKWSQDLEPLYSMDASFIIKKGLLLDLQYPVGKQPYLFETKQETIEIDTLLDFRMAQELFRNTKNQQV